MLEVLKDVSYDESTFETATRWMESENSGCRAIGFLVRNRFSRGGLGKAFAWSERLRGGQPGDVNAWDTIRAEMPAIAERVKDVVLHCEGATEVIGRYDGPDTLHYVDPPYLHETR